MKRFLIILMLAAAVAGGVMVGSHLLAGNNTMADCSGC
jgi:hypothetical protein